MTSLKELKEQHDNEEAAKETQRNVADRVNNRERKQDNYSFPRDHNGRNQTKRPDFNRTYSGKVDESQRGKNFEIDSKNEYFFNLKLNKG